ncbi:MAG: glycosyltransferase family 39 protein [Bryobacterales bacterium]|nr:glycosyltransferase family 39 protein [Bryobacterales bacterium]
MSPWADPWLALAGGVAVAGAAMGAGRELLRRLDFGGSMEPQERWALSLVAGAAVLSLAILALAALKTGTDALVAGLLILVAAGWAGWRPQPPEKVGPVSAIERVLLVATGLTVVVYALAAMAPIEDADGFRYHLGFPWLYLHAGGMAPLPTDFYAAFPQAMEMLYLPALRIGGFAAANILHLSFFVATALLLWTRGRVSGASEAGAAAALAFCASPVAGVTAASASVDVALAAALFATYHCAARWRDEGGSGWLVLSAIAAGFACGIKYTGCVALAILALMLAKKARAGAVLLAASVAALWIAPWLIRNWTWYGNPVLPFLNAWFPNPHLLPASEQEWVDHLRHYNGVVRRWPYVWEVMMRGVRTEGLLGPVFLLLPAGLLALVRPWARWLWLAGALACLPWIWGNPLARFAVPALPFLALTVCSGLGWIRGLAATAAVVHAALCFPPVIGIWNKQQGVALTRIPWSAWREPGPEVWRRTIPSFAVYEWININLPGDARILDFEAQYRLFTTRHLDNYYASEAASGAAALLERAADPSTWPSHECQIAQPPPEARRLKLRQRGEDAWHPWTLFGIDIPGASAVSAHARPNPWTAHRAIDRDPATYWSSREPMRCCMEFEMTFDSPALGPLTVVTNPAQRGDWEAATSTDGTWWSPLENGTCELVDRQDFPPFATREVRRRGWTHVLAGPRWPWREAALADPGAWGLRVAFRHGDLVLFAIATGADGVPPRR